MGVQLFFCGEKGRAGRVGIIVPLLSRALLVLALLIDATLEVVECDQRLRFPSPSLLIRSVESTATLFLRLLSCDIGSRESLSAISEVSVGLCAFIGRAEFRAPVPDELSEPVRFTVTTDAEERELVRDEWRWCLWGMEWTLPPFDVESVEMEVLLPCRVCILVR